MPTLASSRARPSQSSTSDNESMDLHEENYGSSKNWSGHKKQSGACVDCKSVKVRCEFVAGERKCRRCQAKNLPCQPRERKKRKAADTHEQLQERSHEQDMHIQTLLKQYDQRVAEQKIHQWMSTKLSDPMEANWLHKGKSPEYAVRAYYGNGVANQQLVVPEVVKHCTLYPEDIQQLFSIFFSRVNPYFSILDENYHTPAKLLWGSPFLFTVLCAVASRYYTARPNLYPLAMEFARDLAGQALVEGHRSVDICQAYLLMSVYPVPKKKWVEDRSWLLMGVAIRMAIELELNQPPPPTCSEQEALNRTRTWLNCYCVDGSHAIQFGKLPMLSLDDYLARNSREWFRSSPLNTPYDVHLCAYVRILMQMAQWRETMKHFEDSSNSHAIVSAAMRMQDQLSTEADVWADVFATQYEFIPLPVCNYRSDTIQMSVAYLRLAVLLAGFQKMKAEDLFAESDIVTKSIDAACSVIQIAVERLYPTGYLRFAMEANFVFMAFAAAFLINLFRPRYSSLLDARLRHEITVSVSRLISILRSNDVAIDSKHTPAVYAKFLSALMVKHNLPVNDMWPLSRSHSPLDVQGRKLTPSEGYSWPDIEQQRPLPSSHAMSPMGSDAGSGVDSRHEFLMDYSLSHFVKTVAYCAPSPSEVDNSTMTWDSWKSEEEPSIMWPQTSTPGIWAS